MPAYIIYLCILLMGKTVYIVKIKGKARIPDYIQVRDETFALIAYFRTDRMDKGLKQMKMEESLNEKMREEISHLPFGKVAKIEL